MVARFLVALFLVAFVGPAFGQVVRGRVEISPEFFEVTLNSGDSLTEILSIFNSDLSDLIVSLTVAEITSRQPGQINQPGNSSNNNGEFVKDPPIEAIGGGGFVALTSSPVPLTCLSVDPSTGFIYAQQEGGSGVTVVTLKE